MWFSLVGEGRKRKESGEPLISFWWTRAVMCVCVCVTGAALNWFRVLCLPRMFAEMLTIEEREAS
jgi:hypothetical protein